MREWRRQKDSAPGPWLEYGAAAFGLAMMAAGMWAGARAVLQVLT